jgi:hypothetical protein
MRHLCIINGLLVLLILFLPISVNADSYSNFSKTNVQEKSLRSYELLVVNILLNPRDQESLAALIGYSQAESLPKNEITQLLGLLDLVKHLHFLNERLVFVANKNLKIIEYINRNDQGKSAMAELFKKNEQSSISQLSQIWSVEDIKRIRQIDPHNIRAGIEILQKYKDHLRANLLLRQQEYRQLSELKKAILTRSSFAKPPLDLCRESSKIPPSEIKAKPQILDQQSKSEIVVRPGANNLDDDLKALQVKFDAVQTRLLEMEKKVTSLTIQIAGMSLDLFNKDSLIVEKEQSLIEMRQQVEETKGRLNLVQQLLQEKEKTIDQLIEDISQLKSDPANIVKSKEEITSVLEQLSKRLQMVNDDQTQKIRQLEDNSAALKIKYSALENFLAARERTFTELTKSQKEQKEKIEYYSKLVIAGQKKLKQLEGILRIYRDSYTEAKQYIKVLESGLPLFKQQQTNLENLFDSRPGTVQIDRSQSYHQISQEFDPQPNLTSE